MNNEYTYCTDLYKLEEKEDNARDMIKDMLNRTLAMFKWGNLPNTIPERNLELFFQTDGFVILTEHEGGWYIYNGGLGEEPDQLYRPTLATIANPAQNWSAQLTIGWDKGDTECECVVGLNDPLMTGFLPIHRKYASEIAENELSIWLANILTRAPWLLSAQNEKTKKSAQNFLDNIFTGKLGVVDENAFLEDVKEHLLTNSNHQTLASLIQLHQYYKADWFNKIGLNAMQNGMKKEAISDSEEQMNQDILAPFVDICLKLRKDFCERVNERYGLDITVELASSWEQNQKEQEIALETAENEEINSEDSNNNEEENLDSSFEEKTDEGDSDSDNGDTSSADDGEDSTDTDKLISEISEEIADTVQEILEEEKEDDDTEKDE